MSNVGGEAVTIAVRGAGIVCALGVGGAVVRARLRQDPSATGYDVEGTAPLPYSVRFDPAADLPRGLGRRLGRQPAMALAAALDAVQCTGLSSEDLSSAAIVLGTAYGAAVPTAEFLRGSARLGARYASPALFAGSLHSTMAGVVGRELGARGPAFVVCNGDASFESALVTAMALLRMGRARIAVVGASEAGEQVAADAYAAFGVTSAARAPIDPFMRETTRGHQAGEGAAAVVLVASAADSCGVSVIDARVGALCDVSLAPVSRVVSFASGDSRSAERHAEALRSLGSGLPVTYPAAQCGAFAALSAVSLAMEVLLRRDELHSDAALDGATLFVNAPYDAPLASMLLSGRGTS